MADRLIEKFEAVFGADAVEKTGGIHTYFAPGRVNLIGEHTDYNGGHVFPCALTLGTWGAARLRSDRKIRMYSENFPKDGIHTVEADQLVPGSMASWVSYPCGVLWEYEQRGYQIPCGMDLLIWGDIPAGSGLSSSAALEVLTGLIVRDLYGFEGVSQEDLAFIGQEAEHKFNGTNCGIMDQFASAMGKKDHAIFLDTNDMSYQYAPLSLNGEKLVLINSKVKHSLVDSAYNDRRFECAKALEELQSVLPVQSLGELTEEEFETHKDVLTDPVLVRRARHAVLENQRTIQAVEALNNNDLALFGQLMNESHASLRDDFEVSCPEIDFLVEQAQQLPGVLGSRITGGGFGGCTVSIVKEEEVQPFIDLIGAAYEEKVGHDAEFYVVEAGDGAHKLS